MGINTVDTKTYQKTLEIHLKKKFLFYYNKTSHLSIKKNNNWKFVIMFSSSL